MTDEAAEATTQADVLEALSDFRAGFARDLTLLTARPESYADRAAAQEGLQLIWSFVVGDSAVTDTGEALLRKAFPYELFGANPEEKFDELRESVEDTYAESWKYSASDHLTTLTIASATTGDAAAVWRYRERALILAALVCDVDPPLGGRSVADVGRYNGMLRRVGAFTEVAVAESAVPEADQVREFSGRSSAHGSIALDYLGILEARMAQRFLAAFVEQYGIDTARELLEESLGQELDVAPRDQLESLQASLG